MVRDRRRTHRGAGRGLSRRSFLILFGIGTGLTATLLQDSGAFTTVTGSRNTDIQIAREGEGIVGVLPEDDVQFNQRDPLVQFNNNYGETVTITVSLTDTSDGILHDNDGNSGTTVYITLADSGSQYVDIKAAVTGTIPYTIDITAQNLGLQATRNTDAVTGYNADAVDIRNPHQDTHFTTNLQTGRWEINNIDVRDNDGDNDLDHIQIKIREGGNFGTTVATETIEIKPNDSDRYAPGGSPDARIKPDDSNYQITANSTYALEFRAYDADGNYAAESVEDTT